MSMRTFFFLIFLFSVYLLVGQEQYVPPSQNRAVQQIVTDEGDTVLTVSLREVKIPAGMNSEDYYTELGRMIYHVKKVYPYAKIAAEIINEYDSVYSALDRKRDQRRFTRHIEKDLKEEFTDELKNLTITQGKYLIKLINRETGITSYEIIKNVKGGMSAFFWQGMAKLFGGDLKTEYQKNSEDILLEYVVRKIERGEIYVHPRERKTEINIQAAEKS